MFVTFLYNMGVKQNLVKKQSAIYTLCLFRMLLHVKRRCCKGFKRVLELLHEPITALTLAEERDLARLAYARSPSEQNRRRSALLAITDDDFDAVIALLSDVPELQFNELMMLFHAHVAREAPDDDAIALKYAQKAFALANGAGEQAQTLADIGKIQKRVGQIAAARESLFQSLQLDPHNKDACKRLAALDLDEGRFDTLADWSAGLADAGVGHARLHAARVLAEAARGDIAMAQHYAGYATLNHALHLSPPAGWDDIAAFNAALAQELLGHRGMRYERYGSASNYSWRIDALARPETPLVRLLQQKIADEVQSHVRQLAVSTHRWLAEKPESATVRNWCVITEGDGFEGWHVHQFGWLSGVYYVQIPDEIAQGSDDGGCIGFGLPEDIVGDVAAQAYGVTKIRPEPGLMLMFPSHTYHRTYPHGGPGKRICVAFDIHPA
jgi:tetratricopeptide (TPR) repeat protein